MQTLTQTVGWAGSIFAIAAFYLVSQNKLSSTSKPYQVLNILAAIGIGANTYVQMAWPAFFLQIIWGGIAVYGLVKFWKK